ncbi:MAG: TIGR03936 family radical SAM-associated protein [Sedimentisphaerales bacterium]
MLAGRYKIHGNIRFLSHQETMRVIARAIIRSGIEPAYSQGYNPHLKLSLPLPRNVGLASDDELFCAGIEASRRQQTEKFSFADSIAEQLPEGLELVSVEIIEKPVAYQPVEVEYLVKVNLLEKREKIEKINEQIRAGSEILIERTVNREGDVKTIDVGKFLKSFEIVQQGVRVFCRVLPTGTIRPDEILRLLNMDSYEVSSSIVRKKVIWQIN